MSPFHRRCRCRRREVGRVGGDRDVPGMQIVFCVDGAAVPADAIGDQALSWQSPLSNAIMKSGIRRNVRMWMTQVQVRILWKLELPQPSLFITGTLGGP